VDPGHPPWIVRKRVLSSEVGKGGGPRAPSAIRHAGGSFFGEEQGVGQSPLPPIAINLSSGAGAIDEFLVIHHRTCRRVGQLNGCSIN
jgi:hypothetical protein